MVPERLPELAVLEPRSWPEDKARHVNVLHGAALWPFQFLFKDERLVGVQMGIWNL